MRPIYILSIAALILCAVKGSGQITDKLYTPNGMLYSINAQDGIGINEDKPDAALHIHQSDDHSTALHINMHQRLTPGGGNTYTNPEFAFRIDYSSDGVPGGSSTDLFSIAAKGGNTRIGYFGVGNEQLMVQNALGLYSGSTNAIRLKLNSNAPELSWTTSSSKPFKFRNTNTGKTPLTLSTDGQVGIHTSNFFDNHDLFVDGSGYITDDGEETHSLYIEGSSIAEEMFVKLKADWGDFVFHRDYGLMPLADLETYIDEKGHLPEMPTAAEVEKEGVKTGETLRLLTIKVEELTLYILQQQKEIDALKEKLEKTKTDENK